MQSFSSLFLKIAEENDGEFFEKELIDANESGSAARLNLKTRVRR